MCLRYLWSHLKAQMGKDLLPNSLMQLSAWFVFSRNVDQRAKFIIGYWLRLPSVPWLVDLSTWHLPSSSLANRRVGGRKKKKMSKMKVTVFHKLILGRASHHILHTPLVRSRSRSLACIQEAMISQVHGYQESDKNLPSTLGWTIFLFIYWYQTVA